MLNTSNPFRLSLSFNVCLIFQNALHTFLAFMCAQNKLLDSNINISAATIFSLMTSCCYFQYLIAWLPNL